MKYVMFLLFMVIACSDTPTSTVIEVETKGDTVFVVDTFYISLDSLPCNIVLRKHGKVIYVCEE